MGAYLTDHPPVRDQWYAKRNRPLTGCTVLHTAESVMDTVGPDTGAEAVAEFIRTRTTPGSYHDLCDSDSAINLVDYRHGAYHDGTGSNNWALSISWACRTSDWRAMSPPKRQAFLRQGAIAFARQQAYRLSIGAPLTELRLITKAQSDAGMSGFIYHGHRDPGRRTDPGVAAPNLFPFNEWLDACRATLAGKPLESEEDTVKYLAYRNNENGEIALAAPGQWYPIPGPAYYSLLMARKVCDGAIEVPPNEYGYLRDHVFLGGRDGIADAVWTRTPPGTGNTWPIHRLMGVDDKTGRSEALVSGLSDAVKQLADGDEIDMDAVATRITDTVTASLSDRLLSQVGDVVRDALGQDNAEQAEAIVAELGRRITPAA